MTEEGIFLGGGPLAGTFKDWTIPNIYGDHRCFGGYSMYGNDVFSDPVYYAQQGYAGGGNENYYKIYFNLSKSKFYKNKTNQSGILNPKHYNIEWWIKYK